MLEKEKKGLLEHSEYIKEALENLHLKEDKYRRNQDENNERINEIDKAISILKKEGE